MADLMGRGPLGLKLGKPERGAAGKAHMAAVARLPCVCCGASPVEVHHCISGRYGQRKASDFDTIPMCANCHRGPNGIHASKRAWEAMFGMDTDYLPAVKSAVANMA